MTEKLTPSIDWPICLDCGGVGGSIAAPCPSCQGAGRVPPNSPSARTPTPAPEAMVPGLTAIHKRIDGVLEKLQEIRTEAASIARDSARLAIAEDENVKAVVTSVAQVVAGQLEDRVAKSTDDLIKRVTALEEKAGILKTKNDVPPWNTPGGGGRL